MAVFYWVILGQAGTDHKRQGAALGECGEMRSLLTPPGDEKLHYAPLHLSICGRRGTLGMSKAGNNGPTETPHGTPNDRLESWKEIAAYLGKDVSTVQR